MFVLLISWQLQKDTDYSVKIFKVITTSQL